MHIGIVEQNCLRSILNFALQTNIVGLYPRQYFLELESLQAAGAFQEVMVFQYTLLDFQSANLKHHNFKKKSTNQTSI